MARKVTKARLRSLLNVSKDLEAKSQTYYAALIKTKMLVKLIAFGFFTTRA